MIIAGQKLTLFFSTKNFKIDIDLVVSDILQNFFLWDEKSTLNGEQRQLRALYVAEPYW